MTKKLVSLLLCALLCACCLPAMAEGGAVVRNCARFLDGAAALGVKIIVTEQYPQGLGATAPEVAGHLPTGTPVIEKTAFSVFGEAASLQP